MCDVTCVKQKSASSVESIKKEVRNKIRNVTKKKMNGMKKQHANPPECRWFCSITGLRVHKMQSSLCFPSIVSIVRNDSTQSASAYELLYTLFPSLFFSPFLMIKRSRESFFLTGQNFFCCFVHLCVAPLSPFRREIYNFFCWIVAQMFFFSYFPPLFECICDIFLRKLSETVAQEIFFSLKHESLYTNAAYKRPKEYRPDPTS